MLRTPLLDELSLQAVDRRCEASVPLDDDAVACVVLATNLVHTAGCLEVAGGQRLLDELLASLASRLVRGDASRIIQRLERISGISGTQGTIRGGRGKEERRTVH